MLQETTAFDVLTFLHLDLSKRVLRPTTTHSLSSVRLPDSTELPSTAALSKSTSLDTQLLGHDFLLSKGCKQVWGVGHHVWGSQIFEDWKDTSGLIIAHYADGRPRQSRYQNTQVRSW